MSRLKLFLDNRDESFKGKHAVNGSETLMINDLLDNFDWDKFDLILDNKNIEIQEQNKLLYKKLKNWGWLALNISEGT